MTETEAAAHGDRTTQPASPSPLHANVRATLKHALFVFGGYALLYTLFFAPVLFSPRLLAPGDGIIYFLPNFAAPHTFWDTSIWGGFPAVGDAQLMTWYPPAIFFSLFGAAGYQPFLLAAYVLASSFTYGYIFMLTRSRLAAAISGCTYGLCAFMCAHAGHAVVVHTAAWLPLVIWSLAMLQRAQLSRCWFVVVALAVACSALAGHPQIFVYTLSLAAAFVLVTGWRAEQGRWRYYGVCLLATTLGTGLAALQLWPTAELTAQSWRAALSFAEFVAYELPLRQVPVLVFPFLYGGAPGTFYGVPYFGAWPSSADGWGAGELSGYAGLLPLLLAVVGFVTYRRDRHARFWLGACAFAFLLTLGEATPLARVVYHLPVLNKFRVPARHFIELTFGLSVLAGLGVASVQRGRVSARVLVRILACAALALGACLLALALFAGKVNALAAARLGHNVTLKPWQNPALAVPLLLFFSVSAVLCYWHRQPHARVRSLLLVGALICDLASFGWFYEWHYRAPYRAYLRAPAAAADYRAALEATQQRLLPVRGGTGRVSELPPNLSKLWGLASASGYGPFILTRTSRLLTMPPHGSVDESWRDPANQSLDLMAVRYLLVPPEEIEPPTMTDERGVKWTVGDYAVDLGPGCTPANLVSYEIELPRLAHATSFALVGALACSVQIPEGQGVLSVTLTDGRDWTVTHALAAGRDFSEWAYDCTDVRPTMQHGRAEVFRSYAAARNGVPCAGHDYVARRRLDTARFLPVGGIDVRRITLRWTGPAGTFALKKLTLLDDATHTSTPVAPVAGSLQDATRWRQVGRIDATNSGYGAEVKAEDVGAALVFENLRARPRAWLVQEVRSVSADEAFAAVRSSRLADGRAFDAARLALVEEPFTLKAEQIDEEAHVEVVRLTAREMEVRTAARVPAFLVTSDTFYPGWRVTVDGTPAHLYQTDYALRGVPVTAGTHVVRFEFRPTSFYYGACVSALSLLLLVGCVPWLKFGGRGMRRG